MNIISEVTGVDVKLNTYCCYQKRVWRGVIKFLDIFFSNFCLLTRTFTV
jgi:hypothetical protein